MNTEKMSKAFIVVSLVVAAFLIGFVAGGDGLVSRTPLSEMTVEHLFGIVIVAALILRG